MYSSQSQPNSPLTVACLQETHHINRFAIDNLFKGTLVNDDGDRNQKGVCILIPEGFEVFETRTSGLGRWAIAVIQLRDSNSLRRIVVATIYAPNDHNESKVTFQDFFYNLDAVLENLSEQSLDFNIAVAGDFNLVIHPDKGSLNRIGTTTERNLATFVQEAFAHRSLLEINPKDSQKNFFTWKRGNCFSKLDYIFVSPLLSANIAKSVIKWYEFGSRYDHACVDVLFTAIRVTSRGRSFPKLFKTDIALESDRIWIRDQLKEFVQQLPPHWNPHMQIDFIKTMLRSKVLELRKMKQHCSSSAAIKEKISMLATKPIMTRVEIDTIENLRLELATAEESESETMRIRAGVKWREEGERSTKYFMSRFKARVAAAAMHSLNVGGQIIAGSSNLISFVRIFYARLYNGTTPDNVQDDQFCQNFFSNCPKIDDNHKAIIKRPLSIEELKISLSTCEDSSPGLDGIPYSFYKAFPEPLLELLLKSWNHAIHTGELAKSHRQSCLTLLPKKGKDPALLSNWRPISLSACDLKIITKAYSNRLKLILPQILCEAQAAYMPGRDISFNNRLLSLAKKYACSQNEDFCVVSLDAKKAFDSVSHDYLVKVLLAYGFPAEFIQVFQTLYNDLESVVQVNGHLSAPFSIKNGVKQGDALSCGLFVLAMDPLIRNILRNDLIEGQFIPVDQQNLVEIKVLAYADDITVICRNEDLQPIFSEYERLSKVSGLTLNADKTEIFNLTQSPANHNRIEYLGTSYSLGRVDKIIICGMCLANDPITEYQKNVLNKIEVMEGIVAGWGRRHITMNGRMVLAKTFFAVTNSLSCSVYADRHQRD